MTGVQTCALPISQGLILLNNVHHIGQIRHKPILLESSRKENANGCCAVDMQRRCVSIYHIQQIRINIANQFFDLAHFGHLLLYDILTYYFRLSMGYILNFLFQSCIWIRFRGFRERGHSAPFPLPPSADGEFFSVPGMKSRLRKPSLSRSGAAPWEVFSSGAMGAPWDPHSQPDEKASPGGLTGGGMKGKRPVSAY